MIAPVGSKLSSNTALKVRACACGRPLALVATRQGTLLHKASWVVRAEREPSTSTKPEEQVGQAKAPVQPAEDLPPWVRSEKQRQLQAQQPASLPWPVFLLLSVIIAIASVGSIFEYANRHAIFGVVGPDSPLWAPILGLFAFTGLPLSGFLFFSGVKAANEAAEAQDRIDGYLK